MLAHDATSSVPRNVHPPSHTTSYSPLSLSAIFHNIRMLRATVANLPVRRVHSNIGLSAIDSLIRRPSIGESQQSFLTSVITDVIVSKGTFIHLIHFNNSVISYRILPPTLIIISSSNDSPTTPGLHCDCLNGSCATSSVIRYGFLGIPNHLHNLNPVSTTHRRVRNTGVTHSCGTHFCASSDGLGNCLGASGGIAPRCTGRTGAS